MLLIIDAFTKFLWGKPFPTKQCAPVARYIHETFGSEGFPRFYHSDNGKEFIGKCMKLVISWSGGTDINGAPYWPRKFLLLLLSKGGYSKGC